MPNKKPNNLDSVDNTLIRGFSKLKRADLLMSLEKKDLSHDLLKEIFIDDSLDSIIRDLFTGLFLSYINECLKKKVQ